MKPTALNTNAGYLIIALGIFTAGILQAQVLISPPNYTVTIPATGTGFAQYKFDVNGQDSGMAGQFANVDNSLNFSLNAGATYIFRMNTISIHPVDICTNPVNTARYTGASAQAVFSGIVTLTIPATNYPTTLYYICNVHSFYGIITVNPPQPPPPTSIIKASVASDVVLTFTGGTNTIQMIPQFSSNLVSGVWSPVPSYTNSFGSNVSGAFTGTNTISFSRLDAICGPDVFLRISQAPN